MKLGKRHFGAPGLARYASLLVSAIALALVFSVAPAQAEECTSSSCVQYNPSIPRPDGEKTPPHDQQTPAKASKTGNGGGTQTHSGTEGSKGAENSGEGESSPDEGAVVGGSDDGKPQGKAGGSANGGAENVAHQGDQNAAGTQASHSSDDGGSSSLVPILIAIAVLAAISVAVVMIRQRRQGGPNAPAAPKAS